MKEDEKNKGINSKSLAKGLTMAAMITALGISLGTEVKSVQAQGNDLNNGLRMKLEGSLALKVETGGTQELKNVSFSLSGTIMKIDGNKMTIKDRNNKLWTLPVVTSNGTEAYEFYHVGDLITGKIVNGQLIVSPPSR